MKSDKGNSSELMNEIIKLKGEVNAYKFQIND